MCNSGPIAVVDSGLGGLTVLRSIMRLLPGEPVVYFGDTARLPYGSKSPEVVTSFLLQIVRFLRELNPTQIVIACNTATALALPAVRMAFPEVAISGVIEPGARAAADQVRGLDSPTVGLLATEATVRSRSYERTLAKVLPTARVAAVAAPLLVPIIEDGRNEDDPLAALAIRQYLEQLIPSRPDAVLLGCTHYPMLRGLIERLLAELHVSVPVVDSAEHCAQDVARRVVAGRIGRRPTSGRSTGPSSLEACWVTDDPARFARLASRFLGQTVPEPRWVPPEQLPAADTGTQPLRQAV